MKALSLWQPWASLYLTDRKLHETRHWPLQRWWPAWQPGDWLAIHAAQRIRFSEVVPQLADICADEFGPHWGRELPTGAIIGAVQIMDCVGVDTLGYDGPDTLPDDFWCGNFAPGRFAFAKGAVRRFTPLPFRGQQGFFHVSDELLKEAA